MIAGVALTLALVTIASEPAPASAPAPAPPAVLLLPLLGDATVSLKQADGVSAQIRAAITADVAKLLPAQGATSAASDQKQAEKCAREVPCLAGVAEMRGADLIGAGLVSPAADGLRVSLLVVAPGTAAAPTTTALRRVEITLQGNEADARRLARLVRSAFNPSALRGGIAVIGVEGADVEIDGVSVGSLPLAPVTGLLEGDHVVAVRKLGTGEFRRSVGVVHGDVTEVKAVLVDSADATAPTANASAPGGIGTDVIVIGAIGGGLVLLGGVAGALSLKDSLDVEARAAAQNLAFPTDADLVARGNILAWTANGLYLAAAVAVGTAAALYALDGAP